MAEKSKKSNFIAGALDMTLFKKYVLVEAPKSAHVKESNFIVSPFNTSVMPM